MNCLMCQCIIAKANGYYCRECYEYVFCPKCYETFKPDVMTEIARLIINHNLDQHTSVDLVQTDD